MKVALVLQPWDRVAPPTVSGSIPIWSYEIARRLAGACEVTVYSKRRPGDKKTEHYEGVRYHRASVGLDRWLLRAMKRVPRFRRAKRPLFSLSSAYWGYIRQIAKDIRDQKCDIAHITNFSQFVPIIRAFNPRIKIVLHMHCDWLSELDPMMIAPRLAEADLIVACSEQVTNRVRRRFPHLADRCHTVVNGVDTERFVPGTEDAHQGKNGHKGVLFVGRLSPEKGLHVLVDAFRTIAAREPEARLDLVGPEGSAPLEFVVGLSDDDAVASLASFYPESYQNQLLRRMSPDLANRIVFVGGVPQSELADRYRGASVLVNPSFTEAFGMSLIEAMSCGVPVVATRVGGMPNIVVDGTTGLLVERGDATALADAILRLLSDDRCRREMGIAGRKRAVERFTWDRVAQDIRDKYESVRNDHV